MDTTSPDRATLNEQIQKAFYDAIFHRNHDELRNLIADHGARSDQHNGVRYLHYSMSAYSYGCAAMLALHGAKTWSGRQCGTADTRCIFHSPYFVACEWTDQYGFLFLISSVTAAVNWVRKWLKTTTDDQRCRMIAKLPPTLRACVLDVAATCAAGLGSHGLVFSDYPMRIIADFVMEYYVNRAYECDDADDYTDADLTWTIVSCSDDKVKGKLTAFNI